MIVYVDAFNLYYWLLKNTRYRWLDIYKLVKTHFPTEDIKEIKYFYAPVSWKRKKESPLRQRTYIDAIVNYIPNTYWCQVSLYEGYFLDDVVKNWYDVVSKKWIKVFTIEEKWTDVNIWVHIVYDSCCNDDFNKICLVSNDSDIAEALKIAQVKGKNTVLLPPIKHLTKNQIKVLKSEWKKICYPAGELIKYTDNKGFFTNEQTLKKCLLPETIEFDWKSIKCPDERK